MSLENHLVLYQAGHCGTFLVWLINQHKNFSQYDFQWKYTDSGHRLDLGCFGADWCHDDETFAESRSKWQDEDGAILDSGKEPRNKNRTKDAIKLLPNHCCQLDSGRTETIDLKLLKTVTEQVQPKSIILPVVNVYLTDELLNRWIAYCKQHNKPEIDKEAWAHLWFRKHLWLKKNVRAYGENSHTIDVGKIILCDKPEYLKLCKIIGEEPLNNIKELTAPIRTMLKENYKTVHN